MRPNWNSLFLGLGVLGLLVSFAEPIRRYLGFQVGQLLGTFLAGGSIAIAIVALAMIVVGIHPPIVHRPIISIVGAGILGAVLFGAEARLIYVYTHQPGATLRTPVTWDFTNVLSTSGVRRGERGFWVSAFIFQGTSTRAIKKITGHVRSNINAEERPIYVSTRDGLVRSDEIQGVPPGARVEVISPFIPVVEKGLGDDPSKLLDEPTFLERFGDFTFVVAIDGQSKEYRFAREDVERFIAAAKRSLFGVPQPHVRARREG